MRTLFSFTIGTAIFASSLCAEKERLAPWNIGTPSDDPAFPPSALVEAFRRAFGHHSGRVWHAKGIILEGKFTPDSQAKEITKAVHLQNESCKIIARFSDFSGLPDVADNDPLANPRALAIRFELPGNRSTDLLTHSYNGFPVSTTDALHDLVLALAANANGPTFPDVFESFLDSHPAARKFVSEQKTPASFATVPYYGVGSFKFTNAKGRTRYVRYRLVPAAGERFLTREEAANQTHDYLMDDMKARVAQSPVVFKLYAQIAGDKDNIKDPSIVWPEDRESVSLGTVEINRVGGNSPAEQNALVFNPANLPPGIEAADGSASFYAKTFRLSLNEK